MKSFETVEDVVALGRVDRCEIRIIVSKPAFEWREIYSHSVQIQFE